MGLTDEQLAAIEQNPETHGNLNLAVAMMATEMQRRGGFDDVLARPAVVIAVQAARKYLSVMLGIDLDNPPPRPDGAS